MSFQEIKTKSDTELATFVTETREQLRLERSKDKFTRKASVIRTAKLQIARALTELTTRRRNLRKN